MLWIFVETRPKQRWPNSKGCFSESSCWQWETFLDQDHRWSGWRTRPALSVRASSPPHLQESGRRSDQRHIRARVDVQKRHWSSAVPIQTSSLPKVLNSNILKTQRENWTVCSVLHTSALQQEWRWRISVSGWFIQNRFSVLEKREKPGICFCCYALYLLLQGRMDRQHVSIRNWIWFIRRERKEKTSRNDEDKVLWWAAEETLSLWETTESQKFQRRFHEKSHYVDWR